MIENVIPLIAGIFFLSAKKQLKLVFLLSQL